MSTLFHEGISLFNQEKYFEAHEAWENLWKEETHADRTYIQGLIQAAGHFVHLEKQNWSGALRLGEAATAKLIALPKNPLYLDLNLTPLMQALSHNCSALSQSNPSEERKTTSFLKTKL